MKTLAGLFGIALLSALAAVAATHGWADLQALQGRAFMRTWDKQRNESADAADWALAQGRLERALQLDPGEPALSEDLGRLHEMRTRARLPAGSVDVKAELGRSLGYLRQSLARRPTSPYTWANIALVKSRLGAMDDELLRAMANAAVLGPWEPEVQMVLADIGFRDWDRLPKASREVVHAAIGRGLKRQDRALFELAQAYRRMDVMCATPGVTRSRRAIRCT